MYSVMQDAIRSFHCSLTLRRALPGIQIAIEAREVAAAHLDADSMTLEEDVAGRPHVDVVVVHRTGSEWLGFGGGFAETGAENAFGEVLRKPVGPHIDQFGGEVGIDGG